MERRLQSFLANIIKMLGYPRLPLFQSFQDLANSPLSRIDFRALPLQLAASQS